MVKGFPLSILIDKKKAVIKNFDIAVFCYHDGFSEFLQG